MNERTNALAMLTAAHREVEAMFEQFDAATPDRQMVLRIEIAATLSHHQLLESRIFFPAARTALDSSELLDAAAVENATTEFLLTRVVDDCASIELVRATMSVLRDHVARHVENEERYIFRRLRASNLDLDALGARMQAFSAACA